MSRAATSRLKVNAPLGSPPTLEWRPLGELSIDPVYQRTVLTAPSQTLIRRIATYWDWGLCQPLTVARRADGSLSVVDGQHRLEGARARGDVPHLPCVITSYANAGDEAAAFVALNQMRRPLNAFDLFKAAVAAEDSDALTILDALKKAGLSLAQHSNYRVWKPGALSNIGGLQRCHRRQGEPVLRAALIAFGKTYPGEVLQYAGTLFPGFAAVASDEFRLGNSASDMIQHLPPLIRRSSQLEWRRAIKAAVGESGGMAREAAEMLFRRVWRGRNSSAAPITGEDTSEMRWCAQCDRKVSDQHAAHCASKFCSLKAKVAA